MNDAPEVSPQAPDARTPSPRRRWLLIAAGGLAALGGAGVAGWRLRLSAPESDAVSGLWSQRFARPEGGELVLAPMRGRPLLVNFWATWCPPCVEELPLLDAFYRQQAPNGWQVIGLAVDQADAVRAFLARQPLAFPVGLAGVAGLELGKSLGNLAGGLPFTVVFGRDGGVVQRKMGKVTPEELQAWGGLR